MKPKLLLCLALVLSGGFVLCHADETNTITATNLSVETNGFLVFEVERVSWHNDGSEIKQKFKVPLTEEFLSNFKHLPNQNSSGTGFCCSGGDGGTQFMWWIRKTADNRWSINMWGEGLETIDGITVSSRNPKSSQSLVIKRLEDLDMSYMLSYLNKFDGINISFTAKYVAAKDIDADGSIPTAPVQKADRSILFKGDDLKNYPLEVSCLFQEG
jgi:hypothetical protein